jgi:hypothetical protein
MPAAVGGSVIAGADRRERDHHAGEGRVVGLARAIQVFEGDARVGPCSCEISTRE